MSSRVPFAPAILGKVVALGALLAGVRSLWRSPRKSGGLKIPLSAAAAKPQPQQIGLSIHRLPRPSELPVADLDGTG
jgi:hypothetical protein